MEDAVDGGALPLAVVTGLDKAIKDDLSSQEYTQNYPYYRFKELNTLGVEKSACKTYGAPVRAYWHAAETAMIGSMHTVMRSAASMPNPRQYITDYCNAVQTKAFEDAGQLLNDVRWYMNKNSNTMKNGRNPETHEVIDELKPIDPLQVNLDAAAYSRLPMQSKTDPLETLWISLMFAGIAAALLGLSRLGSRMEKKRESTAV